MYLTRAGLRHATIKNYVDSTRHLWRMRLPGGSAIASARFYRPALLIRSWSCSSGLAPCHKHPLPAGWLRHALAHPDPVYPLLAVCAFLFMTRASELSRSQTTGCRLASDQLYVADNKLFIFVGTSKTNKAEGSLHERQATGGPLCPVALFNCYAASRPDARANAPALQWLSGKAVATSDITQLAKALAAAAGADPTLFSSHSFRSGGASAAFAQGMSDGWVMREGRWRSIKSMLTYIRMASAAGAMATSTMLSSSFVPHLAKPRATNSDYV